MTAVIRSGTAADVPAALELIRELALYERAPDEVVTTVDSMNRDGFGPDKVFDFLVAELESKVVGIALYFPVYSTWKGRMLYLDDLVVTESLRGKGVGKQLFDAVIAEARRQGATRLRWQVLDWNEPAIRFYQRYQAHLDPEWLNATLVL